MADRAVFLAELPALLRQARQQSGLTQAELHHAAKRPRSWIAAVESGVRYPSLPSALDLGRALRVPDCDVTNAWFRDEVRRQAPEVIPQLARRVDGTVSVWDRMARDRIRVADGIVTMRIDPEGTLEVDRDYRRCTTSQPRRRVVIRSQILGESPDRIDVVQAPDHEVTSRTRKVWREHEISFAETWEPSTPIHIGLRVRALQTYLKTSTGPEWEERLVPGMQPSIGFFAYNIRHSFERLTLSIFIAPEHRIRWLEPAATIDDAMLTDDPADIRPVAEVTDATQWTTDGNSAELKVIRPLPTYRLYLRWESLGE